MASYLHENITTVPPSPDRDRSTRKGPRTFELRGFGSVQTATWPAAGVDVRGVTTQTKPKATLGSHPTPRVLDTNSTKYPLVMSKSAIENGHRNSEFSHETW